MRGVIFANGKIDDVGFVMQYLLEDDFIICLDGGLCYTDMLGLVPNIIAGDFDSVDVGLLAKYENSKSEIIRYPVKKDLTDMEIGINLAVENGITELLMFGALGGRVDHLMANIANLSQAMEKGIKAVIIDEKQEVCMTDKAIRLNYSSGTVISLLSATQEVTGVTTKGLSYPMVDESLVFGYSRGVSNVLESNVATVTIKTGLLLIIVNTQHMQTC